jgi:MFS family permease
VTVTAPAVTVTVITVITLTVNMFVSRNLSANFVAVGGALLAPWLCDGLGRRKTFSASCIIFIVGVSFVVLAPSLVDDKNDAYGLMMFGRVLTVSCNTCLSCLHASIYL